MGLIYTDRSRQERGLQECMRARYWEYSSLDGFGIRRKGAHIYMQTGLAVHEILARVLQALMLTGKSPESIDLKIGAKARNQIRAIVKDVIDGYRKLVADAGWLGDEGSDQWTPEDRQQWLDEQACLVEGLAWGWIRTSLPKILREFAVITAEREETYVVGCTCGIGDGTPEHEPWDHEKLNCAGVCQQSRPDIILQRRMDCELGVHDYKTMAAITDYEMERYRNSVQMAVGTVGVERRKQVPVTHYYVHAMKRGVRKSMYDPNTKTYTGPKQQQSDFCYVTYEPAAPPLRKTESVSTKGKWYEKHPVWTIPFESKPKGVTNIEWLVEILPIEEVAANYELIGPYARQGWLIKNHLRQVLHAERNFNNALFNVYEKVALEGRPLDEALAEEIPASWQCNKYGRICDYWPICSGELQPTEIEESGLYEPRIPHHVPELYARALDQGLSYELPVYVQDGELLTPANDKTAKLFARINAATKTERKAT